MHLQASGFVHTCICILVKPVRSCAWIWGCDKAFPVRRIKYSFFVSFIPLLRPRISQKIDACLLINGQNLHYRPHRLDYYFLWWLTPHKGTVIETQICFILPCSVSGRRKFENFCCSRIRYFVMRDWGWCLSELFFFWPWFVQFWYQNGFWSKVWNLIFSEKHGRYKLTWLCA